MSLHPFIYPLTHPFGDLVENKLQTWVNLPLSDVFLKALQAILMQPGLRPPRLDQVESLIIGAALQLWICISHSQACIVSYPPTLLDGFWTFLLQFCNIHANVSGVRWKKYLPAPQPRRSVGQRHDVIAVLYHPIVLCSRLVDTKKKKNRFT